jgi:hypothetical protein
MLELMREIFYLNTKGISAPLRHFFFKDGNEGHVSSRSCTDSLKLRSKKKAV